MRIGIIGFGTIAEAALGHLAAQHPGRLEAVTILVRKGKADEARRRCVALNGKAARLVEVVETRQALLASAPDMVIECAGHEAVTSHGAAILEAGIDLVLVSIGALADAALHEKLIAAAKAGNSRLVLLPGAIGGIDLLSALAAAGPVTVAYTGTKPPGAWAGSAAETVIDLAGVKARTVFFRGTAREAAGAYPKNANVAATLALAAGSFEAVTVELAADPAAPGNVHAFEIRSIAASVSMTIANQPSPGNAKTSYATVLSVCREITNRMGPVAI